ncbi:MAG: hypothetical protein U1F77_09715 [Kiritimatiellia bacterium]
MNMSPRPFLVLCLLLVARSAGGTQQLVNPGFEIPPFPSGWTARPPPRRRD